MNETLNTKTELPVMELRETLRRLTWLVGMLAVIATVAVVAHEPFGRMIEQRQEAGRPMPATGTMLAQR